MITAWNKINQRVSNGMISYNRNIQFCKLKYRLSSVAVSGVGSELLHTLRSVTGTRKKLIMVTNQINNHKKRFMQCRRLPGKE